MKILVIGSSGNMGKRYAAILNALKLEWSGIDLPQKAGELETAIGSATKIIVATPTPTHMEILRRIDKVKKVDVLCEKPVVTNEFDLEATRKLNINLFSVNQYQYLPFIRERNHAAGQTFYNYYNSGKDGIGWDHFQLFALAKGTIEIQTESPVWVCSINGIHCNIADMDRAYLEMVHDFLGGMQWVWGLDIICDVTERIIKQCGKY